MDIHSSLAPTPCSNTILSGKLSSGFTLASNPAAAAARGRDRRPFFKGAMDRTQGV